MKHITLFLLAITAFYIPFALLDYHHLPYSDGAEHGAAVRELACDIFSPGEPMLSEYVGKSPRYVPSVLLMAATMRLTGMNVLVTLKLFSIIFFLFFLVSTSFFACEYFQDPLQAVWAVVSVLFLWGVGWIEANAFMFAALIHSAYYPSLVAFSFVLIALACACRFLRGGHAFPLSAWCLFGAIAFVNHPPTALFLWIASALLILEIRGIRSRCWFWYIGSITVSIIVMAAWPYYDFLPSFLKIAGGEMASTGDYLGTRKYLYSDIVLRIGPALGAIPAVFFYLIKRKYLALTLFCLIAVCIYTAGYFLHISLAERFIFAALLCGQLLFARLAYTVFLTVRKGDAPFVYTVCFCLIAVLLAVGAATQGYCVYRECLRPDFRSISVSPYVRYEDPTALYKQFALYIKEGDVVFSDPFTSWGIPLYTGAKIISLFHTPTHVMDNDARNQEVIRFYDPAADNFERMGMIRRFGVTKILLYFPVNGENILAQIKAIGLPIIMCNEVFCIFDVPGIWEDANSSPSASQH
jgi:hypothetical protein